MSRIMSAGLCSLAGKNTRNLLHFCCGSSKATLVKNLRCIVRLLSTEISFKEKEEDLSGRVGGQVGRRLWSERAKSSEPSSPFDDLGSWHSAKPKSVLHNLTYDAIGHYSSLGYREVNEDRVKIVDIAQDLHYIGIFDGHAGAFAVDYVSENLHKYVRFMLRRTNNLQDVLSRAFEMCNDALAKYCKRMVNVKGLDASIVRSGTTATVALLQDGVDLAIASAGDSGAVLCRNGQTLSLTNDHHPSREDELQRIKSYNGWIDWESRSTPMVNGRLAMTRSLGDFDLKGFGVISKPETSLLKINSELDAFLVLHTDGISYVMSNNDIIQLVRACSDPHQAAHALTCCAMQYGSEDNATAIVVPLRAWNKFHLAKLPHLNLLRNMRIKYT